MRVTATRDGYYADRFVKAGTAFTLTDPSHFSSRWMATPGTVPVAVATQSPDAALAAERIAAGGITEALAVEREANAKLKAQVEMLLARVDALSAVQPDPAPVEIVPQDAAPVEAEPVVDAGPEAPAEDRPRRVRRTPVNE